MILTLLQVFVNGLQHSTFKHRIPLEKVSTLDIRGDVSKPIYGIIDVCTIVSYEHIRNVLSFQTVPLKIMSHIFLSYSSHQNWSSTYLCLDQSRITGMGNTFSSLLNTPADLSYLVIQPVSLQQIQVNNAP